MLFSKGDKLSSYDTRGTQKAKKLIHIIFALVATIAMMTFFGPRNFDFKPVILIFKEAAPKSSVYGGVKTFSNKKGLVGRMTMIQSALDSSDLGEYFRYPQRHEKVYRKFFRDV